MSTWIPTIQRKPKIGELVIFTCEIDGEFRDIEIGKWTGGLTAGVAIVMDYGEGDDWLPCSHWLPIPPLPDITNQTI
jgi:hypothetical protein